jgi:3-dehydroquinate dehydratase-2
MKILVLNGPNLNLLGTREKAIYGTVTLSQIVSDLEKKGSAKNVAVVALQSNHEGEMIDFLHQHRGPDTYLILNAGGLSHTSVSLRDAVVASEIPMVEVHISNIYKRESFRHHSFLSEIALGVICGFGPSVYELALEYLLQHHPLRSSHLGIPA